MKNAKDERRAVRETVKRYGGDIEVENREYDELKDHLNRVEAVETDEDEDLEIDKFEHARRNAFPAARGK